MNAVVYILHYALYQAFSHGVCAMMNVENKAAREKDPLCSLVVSVYHDEHPMAQLWLAINKEQWKLVDEYEQGQVSVRP